MIDSMIINTMKEAIKLQSSLNNVPTTQLRIFITPNEDYVSKYFLVINGVPVTNEETGLFKYLDFNADILNKKFDLLSREQIVANFLASYFKTVSEVDNIERQNIFASVSMNKDNQILISLYNGGQFVRNVDIKDLFVG